MERGRESPHVVLSLHKGFKDIEHKAKPDTRYLYIQSSIWSGLRPLSSCTFSDFCFWATTGRMHTATVGRDGVPTYWGTSGRGLQMMITAVATTDFLLFGYDQGVMSGIISAEAFTTDFPEVEGNSAFRRRKAVDVDIDPIPQAPTKASSPPSTPLVASLVLASSYTLATILADESPSSLARLS